MTAYFIFAAAVTGALWTLGNTWRGERLPADVAAELHAFELNVGGGAIRDVDRVTVGRAAADDGEHAPAAGDDLAVPLARPGVKDHRARHGRGGVESGNRLAALRLFWVT